MILSHSGGNLLYNKPYPRLHINVYLCGYKCMCVFHLTLFLLVEDRGETRVISPTYKCCCFADCINIVITGISSSYPWLCRIFVIFFIYSCVYSLFLLNLSSYNCTISLFFQHFFMSCKIMNSPIRHEINNIALCWLIWVFPLFTTIQNKLTVQWILLKDYKGILHKNKLPV